MTNSSVAQMTGAQNGLSVFQAGEFGDNVANANAIGSDKSYRRRPEVVEATGLGDDYFATLIHPGASVSARAKVGRGTVINFGASVGGEVEVGRHATLGPGCVIGHNVEIADHAVVAPGAVVSGFVRLGRGCYVGAGATVKQKVTIGELSTSRG